MITATCPCGKTYRAKPELAGRRVRCRACGERFIVPLRDAPIAAEVKPAAIGPAESESPTAHSEPQPSLGPSPVSAQNPLGDWSPNDIDPNQNTTSEADDAKDWTPAGLSAPVQSPGTITTPIVSHATLSPRDDRKFGGVLVILLVVGAAVLLPVLCIMGGLAMIFLTLVNDVAPTVNSPTILTPLKVIQETSDPVLRERIPGDLTGTFGKMNGLPKAAAPNEPEKLSGLDVNINAV